MCGRYATSRSSTQLSAVFEAYDETGGKLAATWNAAPTDPVPVVRVEEGGRVLDVARWGLLPHWAKSPSAGARMINARAETVATSRAYAGSFARRRCLVPADGWYEWVRGADGAKQPYFLTPRDGDVLAFAGIWSTWPGTEGGLLTCSVLTTEAAGELTSVHQRMPLLLTPDRWDTWLTSEDVNDPELLAAPDPAWLTGLEIRPVGAAVGNVRNDGPALTERVSTKSSTSADDPQEIPLF